jgi:serine phosphatase RsbU (regulator of sigma subunit)
MPPARPNENPVSTSVWRLLDPPISDERMPEVRRQLLAQAVFSFAAGLILLLARILSSGPIGYPIDGIIIDAAWAAGYIALGTLLLIRAPSGNTLLRLSILIVVIEAAFGVLRLVFGVDPRGASLLVGVLVSHAAGALLLPWTPLRALLPALGAGTIATIAVIAAPPLALGRLGLFFAGIGVCIPGLIISVVRNWREQAREMIDFFRERYHEMRQELVDARLIHEAAFPPPRETGAVRFDYAYEPMSQIGGDYLHAHTAPGRNGPDEALSLAILDVTGHGIPAALTVNRLHGELARLYAENPHMPPGAVLAALNNYVYLTLADHSVFVTGIVLRIDPTTSQLEFASAGHPPAFLRRSDGRIEELPATATVLGAFEREDFDPAPISRRFMPGDSLIAYTDGAMEAQEQSGERLEVSGLRKIIEQQWADHAQRWPQVIAKAVHRYRHGKPDDDVLVIEAYRTLGELSFTSESSQTGDIEPQQSKTVLLDQNDAPGTPDQLTVEPTHS